MKLKRFGVGFILMGTMLVLASCAGNATPSPTEVPCPEVECQACPDCPPPIECPKITAPTTALEIIANKCVRCHVALPPDHTDTQDSDQCGLCHIPYGNIAEVEHTATTEGCVMCHNSPEVTHFYLRDEEDQTVLAANAEERCFSCHRDGGAQTLGKGTPPLETEEDILKAVELGTLRSWIQPGGFMTHYLTPEEAATITAWVDSISADRALDYDPNLVAAKIENDFEINGLGDNPAWNAAEEHVVSLTPTIFTAANEVKLKALYSDKYLYIRVEYTDSTASLTRGGWILEDGGWRHPKAATQYDKQSEDRISIIWNISTPDFKDNYGCGIKCHGNVPGSSEFTDLDMSTMDIWHSKAARGLGLYSATDNGNMIVDTETEAFEATGGTVYFSGVLDDKRLVWYMDLNDGYDLEDSGRRGDKGGGAYSHNRNGDKSAPLFIEIAPGSWADAMILTAVETSDGSAIIADPSDPGYDAAAAAAAWDNYIALGALVPERILKEPGGSRADVLHSAVWQDGVWINEFRRALVTGHSDDVNFDLDLSKKYEFSIALFDNCGRGEIPPGHTTYGDGQYQVLIFGE